MTLQHTQQHLSVGVQIHPLLDDEWVEWITENDRPVERQGNHRFQRITVRRGEYEHKFDLDLGPSVLFPGASPFQFFAGGFYRVGECVEIAARARENRMPEEDEPLDLLDSWTRKVDEKAARRAHRSVSGPHFSKERS